MFVCERSSPSKGDAEGKLQPPKCFPCSFVEDRKDKPQISPIHREKTYLLVTLLLRTCPYNNFRGLQTPQHLYPSVQVLK